MLVLGVLQRLRGRVGGVLGTLQAAFTSFCIRHGLLQIAGLRGACLLGLGKHRWLLPGVLRQGARRGLAQLFPLAAPLGHAYCKAFQLAVQAGLLAEARRVPCIQLLSLVLQCFKLGLCVLQRSGGGRGI
ncbi:hypothetical protein D3C72_960540 [compost metagenome]